MSINECDRVFSGAVRELASIKGFERIHSLVESERTLRRRRRNHKKMVDTLGVQHFKIPELNKRAFVCFTGEEAGRFIEGCSDLASPPLSMPSSAKPSAMKLATP